MEEGQRVIWNENGGLGTVKWVTKNGTFAVNWDDGQYVEYNIDCSDLISIMG
ncbi:hypothetical protein QTG56_25580 (plasmid) [Rossellomorea sp. AcN35-11]|nr:hypothetical protein [Rossellomorea aquimaris]WJV31987.1 hypothetical protein QTG56_25580 [Rossellomorea sp. AcN35-11]